MRAHRQQVPKNWAVVRNETEADQAGSDPTCGIPRGEWLGPSRLRSRGAGSHGALCGSKDESTHAHSQVVLCSSYKAATHTHASHERVYGHVEVPDDSLKLFLHACDKKSSLVRRSRMMTSETLYGSK